MANTFKGNKLIYIPVTTTPDDIKIKYPPSADSSGRGKQCSWWSDNPLLPYNAMLVSAYYGMDVIEDRNEIRDEVLFFGDSGGFQILQNKSDPTKCTGVSEKLTPENVIKWQMKVCDIGMTLDIPTPRTWDLVKNRKIFEDRLKESKKNAIAMLEYKNKHMDEACNPDFKLFNCIQGTFYEDMERWYDVTTNHHEYEHDGFSLSNSKIKYVLPLKLGFAVEHSKGKPFHILGTSSPQSLALIAYANKYTKTQVYFDSSSAATGKTRCKYMLIWDMVSGIMTFKKNPKRKDFDTIACPCPICSQLEKPSDLYLFKTLSGTLLTLHNLYWMRYYTEFMCMFVYFDEEFKTYTKKLNLKNPSLNLKYMEFLDCVYENGLETAWNKYFKRNKLTDSAIVDESNTENCDILALNAVYNSKILDLQKNAAFMATKACNDMMKEETRNPYTQEIVKVEELVEEELAEVSATLSRIYQKKKYKNLVNPYGFNRANL